MQGPYPPPMWAGFRPAILILDPWAVNTIGARTMQRLSWQRKVGSSKSLLRARPPGNAVGVPENM